MTLEEYFRTNYYRKDPHQVIDHKLRVNIDSDGRVTFYIHADSVDSETPTFAVYGNTLINQEDLKTL